MPVQNELFGLLGRNSSVILDPKKSLQKTASLILSASLAEPVRSTAPMPEITHLWDLSWSPGPCLRGVSSVALLHRGRDGKG